MMPRVQPSNARCPSSASSSSSAVSSAAFGFSQHPAAATASRYCLPRSTQTATSLGNRPATAAAAAAASGSSAVSRGCVIQQTQQSTFNATARAQVRE